LFLHTVSIAICLFQQRVSIAFSLCQQAVSNARIKIRHFWLSPSVHYLGLLTMTKVNDKEPV
jgi:hypothetical protein